MAAVIVTTTPARRSVERTTRPPLQVIPGGRKAARAHVRAQRATRPLAPAVYRRRRIGALLVLATLVLVAVLGVGALRSAVSAPGSSSAGRPAASVVGGPVHVVQPGDTLWSIARSLHPHGDIRVVVDRLEARLGGATLQPGQRVSVDGLTN